jgi:putative transcriptional regulator
MGAVTIATVPGILEGGSKNANLNRLEKLVDGKRHVAAAGIEAYAALRKIGVDPRYFYAVPSVAVEATRYGLEVVIVAVSEELPGIIKSLSEADIKPHIVDLRPTQKS